MTRPQKYLTRIIFFLIPVILLCAYLYPRMAEAFLTNPGLNGLIGAVLLIGIIFSIRQVTMLSPAVVWINNFRKNDSGDIPPNPPAIITPMAAMMGENERRLSLSALSMRTILDGIAARMDEGREITRYMIGLLIFLGLLGTFWGLLGTIGSIKDTIANLTVGSSDITHMFEDLKEGLSAPLGGMGTAFSSSLFGLAGSVILGFIDLQAGQAQSRFFNDLEDWLSTVTKLSRGGNVALDTGDASVPAYVSALLEQSADSLDRLHGVISRSEENRNEVNTAMINLSEQLAGLADSHSEMRQVMKKMLELFAAQQNLDHEDSSLKHLRNIDVQIKYLTEETIKGQSHLTEGLKSEFKLLARTLGGLVDEGVKIPAPSAAEYEKPPHAPMTEQPMAQNEPEKNVQKDAHKDAQRDAMDYDMPTPKPKANKKPALAPKKPLSARKDD